MMSALEQSDSMRALVSSAASRVRTDNIPSSSTFEHPKFQAFLSHAGLPTTLRRDFSGPRLDAKFNEAKAESEAKIRDATFFSNS